METLPSPPPDLFSHLLKSTTNQKVTLRLRELRFLRKERYHIIWTGSKRGRSRANSRGSKNTCVVSVDCSLDCTLCKSHTWSYGLESVDTHFRDTFYISSIQPRPTSLLAQFIYCVIFYSFKHGPSPCDILGKLRKCGLEGQLFSDLLHEPRLCMLPSGQEILVAHQAHGGGLVPKISTPK